MIRNPQDVRSDPRLAINGGRASQELPSQDSGVVPEAADAVAEIVRSGMVAHWRGGPATMRLETEFARRMQRERGCFTNSGTAAVLLGLLGLKARDGTAVGLTAGYVSAINTIYHARARPIFLKTDPETLCAAAEQTLPDDRRPELLLATHFLGNAVDVERLAGSIGAIRTIVDASQALGATIGSRPIGAVGDVVAFSGSYRKLLGSGTGGVAVFDDEELEGRIRTLAYHGIDDREVPALPGFSFAGNELEATLGLAALERLDERVEQRRASAAVILRVLHEAGIETAVPASAVGDSIVWFKVGIILPEEWLGHRDWLVTALRAEGVPAWRYPSLIAAAWVRPWMERMGWWGDWEQEVFEHERRIWERVVTLDVQVAVPDATAAARKLVRNLAR